MVAKIQRRQLLAAALTGLVAPTAFAENTKPASTERAMRMKFSELTPDETLYVIEHTNNAVLSTTDASGTPYGVPITPLYSEGKIYFHGTKNELSRKLQNMRQNPRVHITWIGYDPIKEDKYTVTYVSAMAAGKAREITDPQEKAIVFRLFCARFIPSQTNQTVERLIKKDMVNANIWEVTIEKLSGKQNQAKNPYFNKKVPSDKPV